MRANEFLFVVFDARIDIIEKVVRKSIVVFLVGFNLCRCR